MASLGGSDVEDSELVGHSFRCLDTGHEFEVQLDEAVPAVLRQTATCPVHHSAAVAVVDPRTTRWGGGAEPPVRTSA
jgi:hypothetical protein